MRYVVLIVLMLVVACDIAGAAEKPNILVAVFSRADENYAVDESEFGEVRWYA